MEFQTVAVNGISLMVLVGGIVQALKAIGVKGRVLTVIAITLGTALAVGYQVSVLDPKFKIVFDILIYGLGGGLASTGYYDLINERFPKTPRPSSGARKVLED